MRQPVILLALALALPAAAQTPPTQSATPAATSPDPARKQARALRLERRTVRLDGRLDDVVWREAAWISDFLQKEPNEGAEPTERTEVAFYYDEDALYVGARLYSNDPSKIQAPLARRDNGSQAEHIWISLDTYHDRRTAYSFGVTASGVRMDWYHPSDNEYELDSRFDPVWEAKAMIDSIGWSAEMRIPFSQLRFSREDVQVVPEQRGVAVGMAPRQHATWCGSRAASLGTRAGSWWGPGTYGAPSGPRGTTSWR